VRRAYTFRLRPTARQHVALGQCLASHRALSNAALQERRDAWRLRGVGISSGDQSAQLKEIRKVRPDVAVWSFSSQQTTLRRLNRAFTGFYRRVRAGQTPGYPRFKPVHRFDSVEWPKDGDGCRWKPDTRRVYLQGIGQVKVTVHRQVEGQARTIQVRRQGRRWMLVLSCDQVPTRPLEPTQAAVGIDVGITDAGWGQFTSILRAEAEEAGPVVIDVDPRHTSDRCHACGHTASENRVGQAVFSCRACGHTVDADEHAARNILRAGLARLAATPAAGKEAARSSRQRCHPTPLGRSVPGQEPIAAGSRIAHAPSAA
jgi:transposase